MTETVTITHHEAKPEYKWEIVVPEGPTVLLPEQHLGLALGLLGVDAQGELQRQVEDLPNGGSRSVNADLDPGAVRELVGLGVKTVQQS